MKNKNLELEVLDTSPWSLKFTKDLGFKAKAKAKAKDLGIKAKAKDLGIKAKAKAKDLEFKARAKAKNLRIGPQGQARTKDQGQEHINHCFTCYQKEIVP